MEEVTLSSWDEFLDKANCAMADRNGPSGGRLSTKEPLFRGHAKSTWQLETTLDRFTGGIISCRRYDDTIRSTANAVRTVSGVTLEFDDFKEVEHVFDPPPNINAMAWLRQNGFPSPLLDWSKSPYVASFFAFNDADKDVSDFVSIYVYIESETGVRTTNPETPTIATIGEWLSTDKKHYLQQSRYTVSREYNPGTKASSYSSHQTAIKEDKSDSEQNNVIKYNIPACEREVVLGQLRKMNVTEYSLFETTESLLNVLARDLYH